MAVGLCLGLMIDTAGGYLGLVEFTCYELQPITPFWLLCLWGGFALTIKHSMAWMQDRLLLAAVAGAVFGPLSYYAGWQLGAMQWLQPIAAMLFISLCWALLMPSLYLLAKYTDQ